MEGILKRLFQSHTPPQVSCCLKLHPGCCAHFPNFIGNLSEILPPGCPSNTSYFMAKTELSSPALQTVSLRHWSTPTPVYRAAAHPWLLCVTPPHSRAPLQVAARIPCILLGFVKLLRRGERLPLPWRGGSRTEPSCIITSVLTYLRASA